MALGTIDLVIQSPASGSVIQGATVTVTRNSDGSVPPVYTNNPTNPAARTQLGTNSITTDADGRCTVNGNELYIEQGTYRYTITGSHLTTQVLIREVVSGDGLIEESPIAGGQLYFGASDPPGWFICDGRALSRTSYAKLYAALGGAASPWGQGDGSTTFNLPDLRQRFPLGVAAAGTGNALAQTGGSIDHQHTVANHVHNVPGHKHGPGSLAVTVNAATTGVHDTGHSHTPAGGGSFITINGASQITEFSIAAGSTKGTQGSTSGNIANLSDPGHGHGTALAGVVGNSAGPSGDASLATDGQAPGTSAANPPYVAVNFIIRHGVQ